MVEELLDLEKSRLIHNGIFNRNTLLIVVVGKLTKETMSKKQELLNVITSEVNQFNSINFSNSIVPYSVPILWFGDSEKYFKSDLKIITVSLNPSDNEFKIKKTDQYSTKYRFSAYNGSINSLYVAYNKYFSEQPYNAWFKASFISVLESFDASHYNNAVNTVLHTDIGSAFATNPTWSGLSNDDRQVLEPMGSKSWHDLMKILEPNIILFSASNSFEKKIKFQQIGKWTEINVNADRPLLSGKFKINEARKTSVLFQIQGRKPFLKTKREAKLKFKNYI